VQGGKQVSTSATVVVERNGFDALGRRSWCSVRSQSGTYEDNYFIYAGANLAAEVNSTGKLLRAYCHGLGVDNLLSMTVHTGVTVKVYCPAGMPVQNPVLKRPPVRERVLVESGKNPETRRSGRWYGTRICSAKY
jgi:hypothetical protein